MPAANEGVDSVDAGLSGGVEGESRLHLAQRRFRPRLDAANEQQAKWPRGECGFGSLPHR